MIHHFIAWNKDKNLGISYNSIAESVRDPEDYICIIDGDAMHLTPYFGSRLQAIINANPSYSLFTCMANRSGNKAQIAGNNPKSNDIAFHRSQAEKIWLKNNTLVTNVPRHNPISGVLLLFKKQLWLDIGGCKEQGMLGIDYDIHWRCTAINRTVGIMQGYYLYHWYRNNKSSNISHLL